MPNTKEVEQAAEALFPTPENPDARSLTNRDVVINCRSAFKGGYNYALSPLEQSSSSRHQGNDTEHLKSIFQKITCNGSNTWCIPL